MIDELCTHIPFFIPAMEEMLCAGLYLSVCLFVSFFLFWQFYSKPLFAA